MEVRCPKCNRLLDSEDVNVGTDTAFCRDCDEAFALSKLVHREKAAAVDLNQPPKGTWFEKTFDGFIAGSTTRHPVAFILVPFMCVWSGGALGGIYGSQIATGEYSIILSLFGLPFVLGSVLFWSLALMAVCGKVTVTVDSHEGVVFTGVGSLGRRKRFNWFNMTAVREEASQMNRPGSRGSCVILEGKERIKFGSGVRDDRRYFLLQALRKMLSERDSY